MLVLSAPSARADEASDTVETEDHSLPVTTHFDEPARDEAARDEAKHESAAPFVEAAAPARPASSGAPAAAPSAAPPAAPPAAFTFAPVFGGASDAGRGEKPAHADPASPRAWHLALGVDTDAPLDVAGRLSIETPGRLRLSTALGTTPQAYASAVDGFLRAVNAYDAGTSALLRAGFGKSLVWRTHVGLRPFENHGFYADAGYALVHLGGDTTAAAVASAAGSGVVSSYAGDSSYALSTTLQMVDAEIGWELALVEGFRLRAAVGVAFTVASSTRIGAPANDGPLAERASQQVDHAFETYGFLPLFTLGLDYRLF